MGRRGGGQEEGQRKGEACGIRTKLELHMEYVYFKKLRLIHVRREIFTGTSACFYQHESPKCFFLVKIFLLTFQSFVKCA